MAFADYHACDQCGENKTFYDANLDPEWVDGHWRYNWAPGGAGYGPFPGYRVYALCHECEKTHRIAIVLRDSDRSGEASETQGGSTEGESADPEGIAVHSVAQPNPQDVR